MQIQQLGPYKILRPIGRGGMGTVYAGVNPAGEMAAIKVLSAQLAAEEGFRDRFEIEIETLKKLNHPNIVRLHGYGEQDGHLYYVMELVEGTNLEEELNGRRRFTWREVTRFGIDLCKALKHAHDRGVIHRDIKPANLLLTTDGVIKLTDFGIARLFGNTRLTSEGGLIGTAEYMSPEQADGRRVTSQCDLYSLGSVLFALMAGRPPFQSKRLPEMLQLQRYGEPPLLRKLVPDAPEELEEIISKLLAKEPEDRVPNAAILGRQLAAMEHGLSLLERTSTGTAVVDNQVGGTDFTLAPTDATRPGKVPEAVDPLGATRVVETAVPASLAASVAATNETAILPSAGSTSVSDDVPGLQPPPIKIPASRFTTVEEELANARAQKEPLDLAYIAQTVLLALSLLGVIGGLIWFLKPPTADQLYATIESKVVDRNDVLSARAEIQSFLDRFPEDSRISTVQKYADEIEVVRAERQLQSRNMQLMHAQSLTPIQRDYREAMQHAELDPQRSLLQLKALVQLYNDLPENQKTESNEHRVTIELAQRQIEQFEAQLKDTLAARLALIDQKLAQAQELAQSNPEQAKKLLSAIHVLYRDKSWADDQVERAKAMLAEL